MVLGAQTSVALPAEPPSTRPRAKAERVKPRNRARSRTSIRIGKAKQRPRSGASYLLAAW